MTVVMAQSIKSISIGLSGHAREGRSGTVNYQQNTFITESLFLPQKAD